MNINELRAEVAKKRRAAGSKISRVKRNTGAKIAGTEYDPRKVAGAEKSMSSRQLRSYLSQLNKFNDRGTQFVGLARGVPAPRNLFNAYKAGEHREKQLGQQHQNSIGGLKVDRDNTVNDLLNMRPQNTRSKVEKAVYGPYSSITREASEIASVNALNKLIEQQRKKFNTRYFSRKLTESKANLMKALVAIGNHEWLEQVARLSNYQFDALWFGNPAAIEAVFLRYETLTDNAVDSPKERWQDKVIENESAEFGQFLNWAENEVPRDRPADGVSYTQTGGKTNKSKRTK